MSTTATTLPLEVEIQLVNGHVTPVFSGDMQVGQTVHYSSKAGDFELRFPPSSPEGATPFSAGGVTVLVTGTKAEGSAVFVLQNPGTFTCRCSLKLANGQTIGWPMDGDQSGGNHVVKTP
jgi:hypothetical protein